MAFGGKHKIADKWSDEMFVVIEQPNLEIPIYRVRRETSLDGEKFLTLHRNPILYLGNSLKNRVEKNLNNKDPDQDVESKQIDEQTQSTVGQSGLGPETEVKNGQDKKSVPVIESKIDNVPNATDDESEDDKKIVVIQTTNDVEEYTEVDASDVSTEIIVPEGSDAGSQSSKIDDLMDAEDALDPDHQDDLMSLEDAHLSDHKEEV